jgi:hypothetical protein
MFFDIPTNVPTGLSRLDGKMPSHADSEQIKKLGVLWVNNFFAMDACC